MDWLIFWWTYFKYRAWLLSPNLEASALPLLDYALKQNKEHDFLDFKRDFFTERAFQKDKLNSEELTKDSARFLLERYAVAFANSHGGFLVVGVAEHSQGFKIQGINYKNVPRKKLLVFLKREKERIKKELRINMSFISLTVNKREVFIFKIDRGFEGPYVNSHGRVLKRIKDETIDVERKKKNLKAFSSSP